MKKVLETLQVRNSIKVDSFVFDEKEHETDSDVNCGRVDDHPSGFAALFLGVNRFSAGFKTVSREVVRGKRLLPFVICLYIDSMFCLFLPRISRLASQNSGPWTPRINSVQLFRLLLSSIVRSRLCCLTSKERFACHCMTLRCSCMAAALLDQRTKITLSKLAFPELEGFSAKANEERDGRRKRRLKKERTTEETAVRSLPFGTLSVLQNFKDKLQSNGEAF